MKIRVADPKSAAALTGGCTFETEVGWWTYSDQPRPEIGKTLNGERDAIYIPTLQKNGEPVSEADIVRFKSRAKGLGFTELTGAAGVWILSTTGEAQVEHIWIAWVKKISEEVRAIMPKLAEEIKFATNQDCVAWENGGKIQFTAESAEGGEK